MIMRITRDFTSYCPFLHLCDSLKQNLIPCSMLKLLSLVEFPHLDIDQHFASPSRIPGNIRETGKETNVYILSNYLVVERLSIPVFLEKVHDFGSRSYLRGSFTHLYS
jgi:hypothetical protein